VKNTMILTIHIRKRKTGEMQTVKFVVDSSDQAMEIIGRMSSKKAPIVSAYLTVHYGGVE